MSKGREEEAKKSLLKLRGANHTDIINAELFRISTNLRMMKKEEEQESSSKAIKDLFTDAGFLKPFGILSFVFLIGLEWTGGPSLAFYLVPILM